MTALPRNPARSTPNPNNGAAKGIEPPPGFLVPIDLLPPRDMSDYKIRRPSTAETFIPIVGPAWEGIADFQDGNYAGAAFNGAMAVAEALPISPAVKLLRIMAKLGRYEKGLASAGAMQKRFKTLGLTSPGREVHHTIPLNGASRTAKGDVRNHAAFLKVMPQEQHRRLTGSWLGAPRYGAVGKIWHGTNEWQKAVPTAVAGGTADSIENGIRSLLPPSERRGHR